MYTRCTLCTCIHGISGIRPSLNKLLGTHVRLNYRPSTIEPKRASFHSTTIANRAADACVHSTCTQHMSLTDATSISGWRGFVKQAEIVSLFLLAL